LGTGGYVNLVPQWQQSWKWLSVHALALAGVLPGVWCMLPGEWRAIVPIPYVAVATGVTSVLGILGRLLDQTPKSPKSFDENRPC
jgi:hypothetical protein